MPGLLTSKLPEGWERSETINGIPYYINHETEKTQWDHPEMVELLEEIEKMNNIKYAAYRTAMKLRLIQKKTQLFMISLPVLVASFDEEGLRDGYMEGTLSASEVSQIISTVFLNQNGDRTDFIDVSLASELTLNWILNIYDPGRSGYIQVFSLKVGLSLLCSAKLQDKYRYVFRQLCNTYSHLDKGRLKLFLQETLQIPKFIYESTAFSGTSVEPAIRNCFERVQYSAKMLEDPVSIPERVSIDEFLEWMIAEPQTIVWLPTLHRLSVSETVKHESKCNICKMYPIIGFRYRCLKCFNFDLCQQCFWSGNVNKSHKIGHPTQEYCLASTQKEDMKDFAKVMKNKVSTKKKKNKAVLNPSKGRYIPINPEDIPSDAEDSPRYMDSADGSSPTKVAPYRLPDHEEQQVRLESVTPALSTPGPDILSANTPSSSQSPDQLTQPLSQKDKEDLEILITSLESENRALHSEIEKIHHLKTSQNQVAEQNSSSEDLAEKSFLRQQQERLQAREEVLEEHNRQLQIQLYRLRVLLQQGDIPQNLLLPSSAVTHTTSSPGPLNRKSPPQLTSLQQHREFSPPRSANLVFPAPQRQRMSTSFSHAVSASTPDTTTPNLSLPLNLSHPGRSFNLMQPPTPIQPAVSLSVPLQTPSSQLFPMPFLGRHAVSLPQVVPVQVGGSAPLGSTSVGELGYVRHPVSSSEELELHSIVERMTTSFPLNVESDMPVEIHGDLFLAASLVGDGMQSMVTVVSRKAGVNRKISGASSTSGRDSIDELCGQDFGQDSHA